MKTTKIGDIWARAFMAWNLISGMFALVSTGMMFGVFYTTVVSPYFKIPFWIYVGIMIVIISIMSVFVFKVGIPAWWRYQRQLLKLEKPD